MSTTADIRGIAPVARSVSGSAPVATSADPSAAARRLTYLYLGTSVLLFLAMGLVGLAMRAEQAQLLSLTPDRFYMLLTLHGTGMIGAALVGTLGALWFVVQPTLRLDLRTMGVSYLLAIAGVVCVAVSTLWGGFAAAWTVLYPLPLHGWWPAWATVVYLLGDTLVALSFGLYCLSILVQAIRTYGGLGNALALPVVLGRVPGGGPHQHAEATAATPGTARAPAAEVPVPPPSVLIATVTAIQGTITIAGGTVIIIALLGQTVSPTLGFDALWAKNITYFFGHSIANLTIYIAAGMLYAILPRFARRPWPTNRVVATAWLAVLVFVLSAYFHHLYMDFVQPLTLDVAGEAITYGAVTVALVVTIFGSLLLVWRSAFRWTLGSLLLYVGFSGWLIGGLAAALDALIPFNFRLHNTLWVPGHFHTYFLLGEILFLLGFLTHLLEEAAGEVKTSATVSAGIITTILVGGYGLVGIWLWGGLLGIPRRYAVQPLGGASLSVAAVAAVGILMVGLLFLFGEWWRLIRLASQQRAGAHVAARVGAEPTP